MFSVVNGTSADDVWKQLTVLVQDPHTSRKQASRSGQTLEVLHTAFSISDPRQRWVVSRWPALNVAFALAEVVWIMNGRRDLDFLKFWNSRLPKFVGSGPDLHGAYGYRLRRHLNLDQLERAYQALASNIDTRQVVLQIWDSRIDLPQVDGKPVNEDVPCNVISMPKIRNDKLEWLQIMRSNDLFLGVPYNLVQFTSVHEVMAGWLDVECGTYNQISDSLHVYERDAEQIRMQCPNEIRVSNTDSLALPKYESMQAWEELNYRVEQLIVPGLCKNALVRLSEWSGAPRAYSNLLAVLVAETARRHNWPNISGEIMGTCTSPILMRFWTQWVQRFQRAEIVGHA